MRQQNFGRILCILVAILFLPVSFLSQDLSTQKEKKGRLRIVVTGNGNAKPVDGADVIVRSGDGEFEDSTKTDSQGLANIASVPHGNLKIQILKMGWKNWGGLVDFKDDKPIQITLEKEQTEGPSPSPTP
jgi:hypothetical protein